MYTKGQRVAAYFYARTMGHNIWANGTILGPAEVTVGDVIREAYIIKLDNGDILDKVPPHCIDNPIVEE